MWTRRLQLRRQVHRFSPTQRQKTGQLVCFRHIRPNPLDSCLVLDDNGPLGGCAPSLVCLAAHSRRYEMQTRLLKSIGASALTGAELDSERSALLGRDKRVERATEIDVTCARNAVFMSIKGAGVEGDPLQTT